MKIRRMGAQPFHAEGHTDVMKPFFAILRTRPKLHLLEKDSSVFTNTKLRILIKSQDERKTRRFENHVPVWSTDNSDIQN
jgi:hypothetical protein